MAEFQSSGGTGDKWRKGAACALFGALESLPEELWARGVLCPAGRAVMLGATSRRVRALLARMQRRVPAAVHVVEGASMEAVACLLYTSPSPRDLSTSRMPSSA